MGLFVGFSILTFAEVLEAIAVAIFTRLNRNKGKHVGTLKVQPVEKEIRTMY